MLALLFQYSTRDPLWVRDDPDNAVIDTERLSVSLGFVSSTNVAGSRKLLRIKKTAKDAELPFSISIFDGTFDEDYYTQMKVYTDPNFVDYRNISAQAVLVDGNYSTDRAIGLRLKGFFLPSKQLGYLEGIFMQAFKKLDDISDQRRYELLTQLSTTDDDTYLSFSEYSFDEEIFNKAESGDISRKQCKIQVHYKLAHSFEMDTTRLRRMPDNEERYKFRRAGRPVPSDTGKYYVPNITYYVYSQNCAFSFSSNGRISNPAPAEWQGSYFFCIILALEVLFALCAVIYVIRYYSPARIEALSLPSMVFHLNAEYLCSVLFIICTAEIPGLRNAASLLAVFGFVVLTPVLLHTIEKIHIHAQRYANNFCKYLSFIMVNTLSFILPGLFVIFISINVPYLATFILCLILASYLVVVIVQKFICADPRPSFPLYFTLTNMLVKIALLTYCFGIDNAFGFEYHKEWIWTLLGVFLSQNVIYIVQYFAGPHFGFSTNNKTFRYDYEMLHQETLKQLDIISFSQEDALIVPFIPCANGNSVCYNPAHAHSSNYQYQLHECAYLRALRESIPKLDLESCSCFSAVPKSQTLTCPICLTDMHLLSAGNSHRLLGITGRKYNRIEHSVLYKFTANTHGFNIFVTPCGHCFHESCLSAWLAENQNCPVDRSQLPAIGK